MTVTVVILGAIIGTYLISSSKVDSVTTISKKENVVERKVTAVEVQTVTTTVQKQKPVTTKVKEQGEDIKLKPHHLYVRSKEQIEKDFKQNKEMERRFFQMKKTRDDQMKNKQFQERVNKTKGKDNV